MMGDAGTGKTALVSQFMTSEYMHTYDASLGKSQGKFLSHSIFLSQFLDKRFFYIIVMWILSMCICIHMCVPRCLVDSRYAHGVYVSQIEVYRSINFIQKNKKLKLNNKSLLLRDMRNCMLLRRYRVALSLLLSW